MKRGSNTFLIAALLTAAIAAITWKPHHIANYDYSYIIISRIECVRSEPLCQSWPALAPSPLAPARQRGLALSGASAVSRGTRVSCGLYLTLCSKWSDLRSLLPDGPGHPEYVEIYDFTAAFIRAEVCYNTSYVSNNVINLCHLIFLREALLDIRI